MLISAVFEDVWKVLWGLELFLPAEVPGLLSLQETVMDCLEKDIFHHFYSFLLIILKLEGVICDGNSQMQDFTSSDMLILKGYPSDSIIKTHLWICLG